MCQVEEGFPYTATMKTLQTLADLDSFDRLGSTIISSILDLNVDYRLKSYGYTSSYFNDNRINQAYKTIRRRFTCDDPKDFIRYALMLSSLDIMCGRDMTMGLLQEYQQKKRDC